MCRDPSHIAGRKMFCGLWKETIAVAEDYMCLHCSSPHPAPLPPSKPAVAMRRLAQDVETQHQACFHSLAQSFLKHSETDLCFSLRKVMDEMVGDGNLNWGRVVSLFTFAGVLARQLKEDKNPELDPGKQQELKQPLSCQALAETIAVYLEKHYSKIMGSSMKIALVAVAGVSIVGLTFLPVR